MAKFNVTFEIITPESAEHGDVEERGFLLENATLRDAVDAAGCGDGGVEADTWPCIRPRWITVYGADIDYRTGSTENRSLHIPESVTPSSARRIARVMGCKV